MNGFHFNGIKAEIKKKDVKDLGIIFSDVPAVASAVFTKNQVVAAPVMVGKEKIKSGSCQAIVVNSGNANCFTGTQGILDVNETARIAAQYLGISPDLVQVSSTGVIGAPMPMDKIRRCLPELIQTISNGSAMDFAQAILTTDTVPKIVNETVNINDSEITITGIAKGSGMIRPNMATMLGFICTDADVQKQTLDSCLKKACDQSFNRISVDGDTSTNDTVFCLANGLSRVRISQGDHLALFQSALDSVCLQLAKMVVKDGEGATKLVRIWVKGAQSAEDAYSAAETIAHSNLVKTAIYGEDPNWGRITAAAGRSNARVIPDKLDLFFNDIALVIQGQWQGQDAEKKVAAIMKQNEMIIILDLNIGKFEDSFYFCDFSEEYVKINADYRT